MKFEKNCDVFKNYLNMRKITNSKNQNSNNYLNFLYGFSFSIVGEKKNSENIVIGDFENFQKYKLF